MLHSADRTGTTAGGQINKLAEIFGRVPEVEIEATDKLNVELAAFFDLKTIRKIDNVYMYGDSEIVEKTGKNEYEFSEGHFSGNIIEAAADMQNKGADRIVVSNYSGEESTREVLLETAREISKNIDIPFLVGSGIDRFEDVKKAFYTGAEAVFIRLDDVSDPTAIKEAADRFGADSIFVKSAGTALSVSGKKLCFCYEEMMDFFDEGNAGDVTEEYLFESVFYQLASIAAVVRTVHKYDPEPFTVHVDTIIDAEYLTGRDIMAYKHDMAETGLNINTFAGKIAFDELKTDQNGLVPCIAQDYKTGEVLMMAYMNREAFDRTIKTGVMTYYSRSRQSLWIKGETSGHYQYLRELKADCDNDTLLAKIVQIGAACHTGNRSCFFNEVLRHEYRNKDISSVLKELYDVVCDRKVNPKEGSYTNYLFNKGIDKILKKCGEEATEMVIAAKNPSHEELKYEIADLMYHMTVLMVECGVSWEEVATELANR